MKVFSQKGISPVIAVILMLAISVVLSISVYQVINQYSQDQLVNSQDNQILNDFNIRVINSNSEEVLIQVPNPNLNLTRVLLDGFECDGNEGVQGSRTLRVNISSCSGQITTTQPRLTIQTEDGIIQRDLNSRDLGVTPMVTSGGGGGGGGSSLGSGPCYESGNVGEILEEGPCSGQLIVDRASLYSLLRSDPSDTVNVFTGQITDMSGNDEEGSFIPSNFDLDISGWDVSNVENMRYMFWYQPGGGYIPSSLSDSSLSSLAGLIFNTQFNQDISSWNVSNVVDMTGMFYGADAFNHDLSSWDVSNVEFCIDFRTNSGMSINDVPLFDNCD